MTSSPRRLITRTVALALVATTLATVPLPTIAYADTFAASVRSTDLVLAPRTRGRSAPAIAADAAERPVLQRALEGRDRRAATRTAPADAIGVTVPTIPTTPILVRGLVDGAWTPWSEVTFAADEGPDDPVGGGAPSSAPVHSQMVWLGHATAFELDGPGTLATARVHLVSDHLTGRTRHLVQPSAGAVGAPAIQPRSAWGARAPRATPDVTTDLRAAVVHHSVSANGYTAAQVPSVLRSIQAYHQDVQGWSDIAYNFAVDRFGRIWEGHAGGIDRPVVGGHARGFNTATVGVVVLGDYSSVKPTTAAVDAVARVIAWKFALHRIDPTSTVPYTTTGSAKYKAGTTVTLPRIVGHRDVQATSCPGAGLAAALGTIRTRVAQLLPGYQAGVAPDLLAADLDGDGLTEVLEVHPGSTADHIWKTDGLTGPAPTSLSILRPYRPVAGDFDGDGHDDVLWQAPGSATDPLWWGNGTTQTLNLPGSYVPAVGDFDGDGRDDLLWYAPGLTADSVWYSNAGHGHTAAPATQDLVTARPVVGDFDGDGRDDVFWSAPGSEPDVLWWSTGRGWKAQTYAVKLPYTVIALHDTPEARDELLFVGPPGAGSSRWEMGTARVPRSTALAVPGSNGQPTVGDFDGDGWQDVLLYTTSGPSAIWFSGDATVTARSLQLARPYTIAAGPMTPSSVADDLLLVSTTGPDYRWHVSADRTLTSTAVG